MLAIAIVLLVNATMGEGGAVDSLAEAEHAGDLAAQSSCSTSDTNSGVVLTQNRRSTTQPQEAPEIGRYDSPETIRAAELTPAPAPADERSGSSLHGSVENQGALSHHRQNIEK